MKVVILTSSSSGWLILGKLTATGFFVCEFVGVEVTG